MPQQTQVYPDGMKSIMRGDIKLLSDSLYAAIMGPSFVFDPDDVYFSDVSGSEISASTSYTSGGQLLTGMNAYRSSNLVIVRGNDPMWSAIAGPIAGNAIVIYDQTEDDRLICALVFDEERIAMPPKNFLVSFADHGLFTLTL